MTSSWKQKLAHIPVLGYVLRLGLDVATLPVLREQLARDTRNHFEALLRQERRLQELTAALESAHKHTQHLERQLAEVSQAVQSTKAVNIEQLQTISRRMLDISRETSTIRRSFQA